MRQKHQRIPLALLTATLLAPASVFPATDDSTTSPAVNMQNGIEAQPSAPTQPPGQSKSTLTTISGSITPINAQSAEVLAKLRYADEMEIGMGSIAQQKSRSRSVKAFGKELVQDHQASLAKVDALAKAQQIDIDAASNNAADLQKHDQDMAAQETLKKKTGADFDKAFLEQMVTDHKNNIEMLRGAQASLIPATSSDVLALIAETLPVMERHQQRASELLQKITGSTQPS